MVDKFPIIRQTYIQTFDYYHNLVSVTIEAEWDSLLKLNRPTRVSRLWCFATLLYVLFFLWILTYFAGKLKRCLSSVVDQWRISSQLITEFFWQVTAVVMTKYFRFRTFARVVEWRMELMEYIYYWRHECCESHSQIKYASIHSFPKLSSNLIICTSPCLRAHVQKVGISCAASLLSHWDWENIVISAFKSQ